MSQPFRLNGQTALITGAGTGIGQATAIELARAGATKILLVGRRAEKLAETEKALKALVPTCEPVVIGADIATAAGRSIVSERAKSVGTLDTLVNNAGYFETHSLGDTDDAAWQKHIDINLTAPFALTRDLVGLLRKSPNPCVINISSTLAQKPIPNAAAYNTAKGGLVQMTRTLALELAPEKVRVNCILPAIVETPMYAGRYDDEASYRKGLEQAAKIHPLGRVGQPSDIAYAALFLASSAASWVTGVALPVDGGMLLT